jgi:hypothetical protein
LLGRTGWRMSPRATPFLSPRTPPFCLPNLYFVAPNAPFLSPEPLFCRPERPPFCRPERPLFVAPSAPFFCRPEAQAEGSLGTCVPRDDMVGDVTPSLFCHPEPPFLFPQAPIFLPPRAPPFRRPEAQAEGSPLYLSPRALARGLPKVC